MEVMDCEAYNLHAMFVRGENLADYVRPKRTRSHTAVSVGVPLDMYDRLVKVKEEGGYNTISAACRDLLEWGMESLDYLEEE